MLVTLSAEHWPLWTTYKLDWQSWLLGNSQLKVSNDRRCRFVVSVFKFTDIGSNSRVWMPGGSEDKDGGQGRCRYQWYTNTTHWLCSLTATVYSQYGVLTKFIFKKGLLLIGRCRIVRMICVGSLNYASEEEEEEEARRRKLWLRKTRRRRRRRIQQRRE